MADEQTLLTDGADAVTDAKVAGADAAEAGKATSEADAAKTADATEATSDAEAAKPGAPESYTDFSYPEGFEVDSASLEALSTAAKTLELTQEQAQVLVNVQSQGTQNIAKAQKEAWDKVVSDWYDATTADKEIDVSLAKEALAEVGTPALREAFKEMGIGNHPEIVRVFAKVGDILKSLKKATGEDMVDQGRAGVETERDPAKILYGDMN